MHTPRPALRVLISAFLAFHLLGVLTAPNPASFLTQSMRAVYAPYLDTLGLSSTWSFFAPEPFYAPLHIDYSLELKGAMPVQGRFPTAEDPFFFRDRYNRRISLTRFILGTEGNTKGMFMNLLCREYPNLDSAKLYSVIAFGNSLEKVKAEGRRITDPTETRTEPLGTFFCPEVP